MRILFANGRHTYPIFHGGDGIGYEYLMEAFARNGHTVKGFGVYNSAQRPYSKTKTLKLLTSFTISLTIQKKNEINYKMNKKSISYDYKMVSQNDFKKKLLEELADFKPDVIITQLNNSHQVVEIASQEKVTIIHYVHDTHPLNQMTLDLNDKISLIVFNSEFTANKYKNEIACPWLVLYPPVDLAKYHSPTSNKKFITMINPIKDKGAEILPHIFNAFPDQIFLIVSGWRTPELNHKKFKNVKMLPIQQDMKNIYAQTKLLIVPSQWEETFGRVVIEAEVNKIPVIASNVGGLPEAVGNGGILVNDFQNPDKWIIALKSILNNAEKKESLGKKGYKHAQKFSGINHFYKLLHFISSI